MKVWVKVSNEWRTADFLIGRQWSSVLPYVEGYARRLREDGFEACVSAKQPKSSKSKSH